MDSGKERYGLNWPGKADCFKTIQMPSTATLTPARREADGLAVRFTGTLGLLQLALKRKWMKDSECPTCVRQLCDRGFRIPRPAQHHTFAEYIVTVQ